MVKSLSSITGETRASYEAVKILVLSSSEGSMRVDVNAYGTIWEYERA